jgi:hypothetical protein
VGIALLFAPVAASRRGFIAQGTPLQCACLRALLSSRMQPQIQSPATNVLRRRLDSAVNLRPFMIDHIDHHSPTFIAVVMDTIAVSLTSRIDPSAIGYEGLSRSPRDTSMPGTCFSCALAAGTTAVIALSTLAAPQPVVPLCPSDHHFVRTSGPQLLYSSTSFNTSINDKRILGFGKFRAVPARGNMPCCSAQLMRVKTLRRCASSQVIDFRGPPRRWSAQRSFEGSLAAASLII